MTTTTMTTFNQSFFSQHFDKFETIFTRDDAHPEVFYIDFYDEFITDDGVSEEDKQGWMDSWKEDFSMDEDPDFEANTYSEVLEENDYLKEDVAAVMISDDYPSIKEKAIPALFAHIIEMWSEEAINDAVSEINDD